MRRVAATPANLSCNNTSALPHSVASKSQPRRPLIRREPQPTNQGITAHLQEGHQRCARVVVLRLLPPPLAVGLAHLVEAVGHDRCAHCAQKGGHK